MAASAGQARGNDVLGTPPQVMTEALKEAPSALPQLTLAQIAALIAEAEKTPNFQLLLAEREQQVLERIFLRMAELQHLSVELPEHIRRRAVMELKQLQLIGLQRSVRASVTSQARRLLVSQHASYGPTQTELLAAIAPATTLTPLPSILWVKGGVPAGVGNPHHSEPSHFGPALGLSASHSHEAAFGCRQLVVGNDPHQRLRREHQVVHRQQISAFLSRLVGEHYIDFRDHQDAKRAHQRRLLKDMERWHRDRAREEERRRKRMQQERLRALRNNDEEEYLQLLQDTKNTRLMQLLRQTDEYLRNIGAQVERQKRNAQEEDGAIGRDDAESLGAGGDADNEDDSLGALKRRRERYYTISHSIKETVHQPKCLVGGTLKPYQLEGLSWLVSLYNNNLNGILADEMGLGKTIQTLALITYLVEVKRVNGPFLVIVPLSTMSNWVRELERWAPALQKVVYRGDPTTRRRKAASEMAPGSFQVVLTTYEFVVRDKNVLGRIHWRYIIIDEGHRMKNADCKLAMTLGVKYTSRQRLLLTGTPLQNNLTELWALLNFLLPTIFSSSDNFETWFSAPFQASSLGSNAELNEEETLLVINRLHQVLRPFLLRRLKTDVEKQLPEKVESVLRCEISVWQKVLYRQVLNRLGIAAGEGVPVRSFNNTVMQLKKICNHPFLFYDQESLQALPEEALIRASGKFELLHRTLRKLQATGHRTLIFSQMTSALDYLETFLESVGIRYLRLDGMTKCDDRQEMLEEFNAATSPYSCFLLSTRAGGLGLNLQTADTVVIFDSDWNPQMDLQAQDRAHRIGQTKVVRVFRLICSGTIEVKILEAASRKLQMDSQIIQAGQFNNKSSETDRTRMLKEVLRAPKDADDDLNDAGDVPDDEDINRLLCRTEEEFALFQKMDADDLVERSMAATAAVDAGKSPASTTRLMRDENELPEWVMAPDAARKSVSELDDQFMQSHGRGRRKRKPVVYSDGVTEREWTSAIERGGDPSVVLVRKQRRAKARRLLYEASPSPSPSRSESESAPDVHASLRVQADMSSSSDDLPLDDEGDLDFKNRRRGRGSRDRSAGRGRKSMSAAAAGVTGSASGRAVGSEAAKDSEGPSRLPPGMDDSTQAAIAAAIRLRNYGLDESDQGDGDAGGGAEWVGSGGTSGSDDVVVRAGMKRRRGRPRAQDGAGKGGRPRPVRSGSGSVRRRLGSVSFGPPARGMSRSGTVQDRTASVGKDGEAEKHVSAAELNRRGPVRRDGLDVRDGLADSVPEAGPEMITEEVASGPVAPLPSEGEVDSHATHSADGGLATRPDATVGSVRPLAVEDVSGGAVELGAAPAPVGTTSAHLSEGEVSEVESGEIAEGSSRDRHVDTSCAAIGGAPVVVFPLGSVAKPVRDDSGGGDEDESLDVRRPRRRGNLVASAAATVSDGEVVPAWADTEDLSGADAAGVHAASAAGASSSEASEGELVGHCGGALPAGLSTDGVRMSALADRSEILDADPAAAAASVPSTRVRGLGIGNVGGGAVGGRAQGGVEPPPMAPSAQTRTNVSAGPGDPIGSAGRADTAAEGHASSATDTAVAIAAMAAAARAVAEHAAATAALSDSSGDGEVDENDDGHATCGGNTAGAEEAAGAVGTDDDEGVLPEAPSSPLPPRSMVAGSPPGFDDGSAGGLRLAPPRRTSRRSSGASSAAAASSTATPSPGAGAGRSSRHRAGGAAVAPAAATSLAAGPSSLGGGGSAKASAEGVAAEAEASPKAAGRRVRKRARKKSIWL
ncbi:hypothetical protein MMPV_008849 [Pyropia vietnamensis]